VRSQHVPPESYVSVHVPWPELTVGSALQHGKRCICCLPRLHLPALLSAALGGGWRFQSVGHNVGVVRVQGSRWCCARGSRGSYGGSWVAVLSCDVLCCAVMFWELWVALCCAVQCSAVQAVIGCDVWMHVGCFVSARLTWHGTTHG
jgi:hypothetical protein